MDMKIQVFGYSTADPLIPIKRTLDGFTAGRADVVEDIVLTAGASPLKGISAGRAGVVAETGGFGTGGIPPSGIEGGWTGAILAEGVVTAGHSPGFRIGSTRRATSPTSIPSGWTDGFGRVGVVADWVAVTGP
jgi:hypothetical protein